MESSAAFAQNSAPQWTGTWSAAPAVTSDPGFDNQTIRQIVHTSIGGSAARLRFSNLFGAQPVTIGDVHLAERASGAQTVAATDRVATFNGQAYVTIPAGGSVLSDAIAFAVPTLGDIAVSVHVPSKTPPNSTGHVAALQDVYIAPGDVSGDASFAGGVANAAGERSYYFLTNVDVVNAGATGAVVAFGASITDGIASAPNTNGRWPDRLAERLIGAGMNVGVLNQGISGNNFFSDGGATGQAGLARFGRDALQQANVKWVIVSDDAVNNLISGNPPTAERLIDAYRLLIAQAHAANVRMICSTLTPFQGVSRWTPGIENTRQAVNAFLRDKSSGCDGLLDQAVAVGGAGIGASAFAPAFNSGDNLHPNDAGLQAIADAANLGWFAALPTVRAPSGCGRLAPGEGLLAGQTLASCDGRFSLTLGRDGYLAIVFDGGPIWSSGAFGAPGVVVRFAEDGTLSLYNANGARVWQTTKTSAPGYAYMQRDGNLVVYSQAGTPVWATGTVTGRAQ
ncbi:MULTISPECIES: GDSL-type esterase/lipase family protein [unclassified Caballeronia]|uniref:GDSL-type esterase/lipase family protein n=1 Tax=unclassified Caballeronia TaxID=2646786 RepID=UPI002859A2A8|nr:MULTISPECIES: GDSL-type esterase/lipase family protein [unclassified Caballeronia]MDR5736400.1 GDSL-type esterase/lipase family protein [Caballeronia sp. LZ016]MDR5811123.1 GDSL-type esterase/lipase family protein [Caballeronia sp. LZ019]